MRNEKIRGGVIFSRGSPFKVVYHQGNPSLSIQIILLFSVQNVTVQLKNVLASFHFSSQTSFAMSIKIMQIHDFLYGQAL